jgi:hypothetical protein
MEKKYIVKNGIQPFAKGGSKMVFETRIVNEEIKEKLENYNDGLIIKRKTALDTWKKNNETQILNKLANITDVDEQLKFMKNIDAIADKMDGSEQCFFPIQNDVLDKTVIVQIPVKSEENLKNLQKEIQLQMELSRKNMMPKIYDIQLFVKFDQTTYTYFNDTIEKFLENTNDPSATIICIYLLEEMCDRYEPENITINQTKNYVNQVVKLAKATADLGYYNTDFKHGNECPSTDVEDGELHLTGFRALDFDPNMLIEIDNDKKDAAAALMFMIYLLHFHVKRDIYFPTNPEVLEKILENGRVILKTMGISNPMQCIQTVEKFRTSHPRIILASYLTATGDLNSIENNRKQVPTLLVQQLLNLLRPVSAENMANLAGLKRKPE